MFHGSVRQSSTVQVAQTSPELRSTLECFPRLSSVEAFLELAFTIGTSPVLNRHSGQTLSHLGESLKRFREGAPLAVDRIEEIIPGFRARMISSMKSDLVQSESVQQISVHFLGADVSLGLSDSEPMVLLPISGGLRFQAPIRGQSNSVIWEMEQGLYIPSRQPLEIQASTDSSFIAIRLSGRSTMQLVEAATHRSLAHSPEFRRIIDGQEKEDPTPKVVADWAKEMSGWSQVELLQRAQIPLPAQRFERDPRTQLVCDEGRIRIFGDGTSIEFKFGESSQAFFNWLSRVERSFEFSEVVARVPEGNLDRAAQLLELLGRNGVIRVSARAPEKAPDRESYFQSIQPRRDDIYLVTYPKSGTTWLQALVHQLVTRANQSFEHIYEVAPYLEVELAQVGPERMVGLPSPRIFKTHLPVKDLPPLPGRYIYMLRNGLDVAVSYYHHRRKYDGLEGSLETFFECFIQGQIHPGSWFEHVEKWWEQSSHRNILYLRYEQMRKSPLHTAREIAEFLEIQRSDKELEVAIQQSSFEFMRTNERKYEHGRGLAWLSEQRLSHSDFIRKGKVGGWSAELGEAQRDLYIKECAQRWGDGELARLTLLPPN